ncbi:class I SAM-dependent methyltransferase [Luteimonas soli]|uniref:Class I SAM-dependent methyltransferase n=1 Tax=Luteimonas soli TaxID=1648966 RepID=A0ABV7XGE1_9GAMM
MSNANGYVEDEEQLKRDLQWNISVETRNREAGRRLFAALKAQGADPTTILEIGCGIGTLLDEASMAGKKSVGFDTNQHAVEYGRSTFGADLRCEHWSSRTLDERSDLTLCISVLEHIAEPRPLIAEIARYCSKFGTRAFISVPFVNRDKWHYLLNPDPTIPGTPFFDNDVHVTHFSRTGLERCLVEYGAKGTHFLAAGLWEGIIADF